MSAAPSPHARHCLHARPRLRPRLPQLEDDRPKKTCYQAWIEPLCNVGSLSNIATFCVFLIGAALRLNFPVEPRTTESVIATYVLSFGLFGFAGGITNELAVKMLFDRIPFLPGSGVIPRQFKEIRAMVKNTMLKVACSSLLSLCVLLLPLCLPPPN